jgi:hypothetical protein
MFLHRLLALDFSWGSWAAPVIGVLAGLVAFYVGSLVLGKRRRPVPWQSPDLSGTAAATGLSTDPFLQGSTLERRTSIRRKGNAIAVLISDAEVTTEPYSGWVVDRSMGGLGITVPRPVAPGTILSVRTTNAPTTCPWVQVEVRSCREVQREFELGCQFVRTPPWSVLLLFG